DRDGNPFVTPDVTIAAARRASHVILGRYRRAIDELIERLSVASHIAQPPPELLGTLDTDRAVLPDVWEANRKRNADEPLRLKLPFLGARLRLTVLRRA